MSTETPRTACPISVVCRNAPTVVLLILLGITTTGWVVTAKRDRPVSNTAPPATAQESPRPPAPLPPAPAESAPPETVEVLVAAKDLPVGTMFTRDELKSVVKRKKLPKDGLPAAYVTEFEDLLDKRISRSVRAEETFNRKDVVKGGLITLPDGYDMVSISFSGASPVAGFVGPGSRVNVIATMRKGNKVYAFSLLVDVLVVAVDTQGFAKDGAFPSTVMVSFAVREKQALLLALAKGRGCNLELLLRHPNKTNESDRDYSIDEVIKLFEEPQNSPPVQSERPQKEPPAPAPELAPLPRPVGEGR